MRIKVIVYRLLPWHDEWTKSVFAVLSEFRSWTVLCAVAGALLTPVPGMSGEALAEQEITEPATATYVAPYLSESAQALINAYVAPHKTYPALVDTAAWSASQASSESQGEALLQRYLEAGGQFERTPADIPGVDAYWFSTPSSRADGPVLVHTHGGAYVLGSGRTPHPAILMIAEGVGARLLSVHYRLAPQHPYPAAVEDAAAAYRWLQEQGLPGEQVGWFGESAGGGLALAAVIALKQEGLSLPAAVAVLSPWTDLTLASESYFTLDADDPAFTREELKLLAAAYYQQSDPREPLVSPVNADYNGFPPLLIQVGSKEIVLSDALRVARKARVAGVSVTLDVWDGMWHVFQFMNVPESHVAIEELVVFFTKHLR